MVVAYVYPLHTPAEKIIVNFFPKIFTTYSHSVNNDTTGYSTNAFCASDHDVPNDVEDHCR